MDDGVVLSSRSNSGPVYLLVAKSVRFWRNGKKYFFNDNDNNNFTGHFKCYTFRQY